MSVLLGSAAASGCCPLRASASRSSSAAAAAASSSGKARSGGLHVASHLAKAGVPWGACMGEQALERGGVEAVETLLRGVAIAAASLALSGSESAGARSGESWTRRLRVSRCSSYSGQVRSRKEADCKRRAIRTDVILLLGFVCPCPSSHPAEDDARKFARICSSCAKRHPMAASTCGSAMRSSTGGARVPKSAPNCTSPRCCASFDSNEVCATDACSHVVASSAHAASLAEPALSLSPPLPLLVGSAHVSAALLMTAAVLTAVVTAGAGAGNELLDEALRDDGNGGGEGGAAAEARSPMKCAVRFRRTPPPNAGSTEDGEGNWHSRGDNNTREVGGGCSHRDTPAGGDSAKHEG
mmetsp:Transcript_113865/g.284822  ORF Transcript_113865/g.284822 Transcript_113865/m.284822 type:complete len:355 (+) Transcript_113865:621-1685(+)